MRYGNIEGLKIPVSRMILGCAGNAFRQGENCDGLLQTAIEGGITLLDTARGYGKSEEVIGDFLTRNDAREKIMIQTKGAMHGPLGYSRVKERCIREDLKKSLAALKTDCVDSYLLHRDNPKAEVGPIVELLNEFHADGKVKTFGVSNWAHQRIEAANEYAYKHNLLPMSASQVQFSLAEVKRWSWIGCLSVTGEKGIAPRAWYRETQFPLMAFSPLGNGFFSGRVKSGQNNTKKNLTFSSRVSYLTPENAERLRRAEILAEKLNVSVPQIALAWLFMQEINVFAVVGSGRVKNLSDNIAALNVELTREQTDYLNLKRENFSRE